MMRSWNRWNWTTRIEERIREPGTACLGEIRGNKLSFMDPKAYTGKLMNWAMEDEAFRVVSERLPGLLQWGLDLDPESLRAKTAAALVGRQPFGGSRHSGVGSKAGGPEDVA